ncbi:aminotransferase class V-fold PLP-dependent enzyme [Dokdonia sinensis]|uniref:Aminotransferase class V-fold PLP-dependent enzyme n=1 Tax=Dokdonia sinensis TaxID=2479847 RepID=A0A3M0G4M4_9FLAO|nr:aminotransferase class V-fold PLP-dependent enzyme [Dokdonia sinensis]RMB59518.1 aminotransferase class V-fold PLP-dependent enzyme [Dokdonia sinensis]
MKILKPIKSSDKLEKYFSRFRKNIVGYNQHFTSPYGSQPLIYADWTASGRLYGPIEEKMLRDFGPYVANTHTETTVSGTAMTMSYHKAKNIIKQHVNANENDVLIVGGNGMTGMVNKFQRILGLKVPENIRKFTAIPEEVKPIVFVSHMEHHSNQTTWLETMATVIIVPAKSDGRFCLDNFEKELLKYEDHPFKIASITACSNVTGIETPYHDVARLMHAHGGLCFVDFACNAPYVTINMHPEHPEERLDAIFFSPHKFLGGPGSSGVLIFNKDLYKNVVPDNPGGGTVSWTNPWGEHKYVDNIEEREDGGTPGFLQTIRIALAIKLKEEMGVKNILQREHEIIDIIWKELGNIENLTILAGEHKERLGVVSFYISDLHFNLAVKLLNDRYGIQTRGGCSCAGTYGHYLLNVDRKMSHEVTCEISSGNYLRKPGWIRMSIHPTMTNDEILLICNGIKEVASNFKKWKNDYNYMPETNEYLHKDDAKTSKSRSIAIDSWFEF